MKKALIVVGSVVALVVVVLLVAPLVIPAEAYRGQVVSQIEKATGREARIEGDFRLSLLPTVSFTAGKVSLANAAGGKAEKMVTLDRLNVEVEILPLLGGTVAIDSFVLEKPVIHLEVDRQGRANWNFAAKGGEAGKPAPSEPGGGKGGGGPGIEGVKLGDVRLVDGTVSYADARSGASYKADHIDMTVSLPSLAGPMKADGSLVWNGEKIALKLGVEKPDAFLNGDATKVTAAVDSRPVALDFKGRAATAERLKASGTVKLDVPSVRKLAAWAGQKLDAPGSGLQGLNISGEVAVDGQAYSFTNAKLRLDKIEASGDFRYDGGGKRPYVRARLDTGMLDLNPYLPPESGKDAGKTPDGKPKQGGAPAAGGPGQWSDDPIELGALRAADADATLTVKGLKIRDIEVGKSQMVVAIKGGKLTTQLKEMALYGGNGTATLVADASGKTPSVTAKADLSGLKAHPALVAMMGIDRIEGTLNTTLDVATSGGSQRAMVSALSGAGKASFADGAIRGINLGAMIRGAKGGFLDPAARETQKTDFTELSASYRIEKGILRNDDLSLQSPLLRVTGAGTVDLPKRTLDYRIEPKLAATAKGQGGENQSKVAGIVVPVRVTGPWHDISYRPDIAGAVGNAVKDPAKALEEGLKSVIPGAGEKKNKPSDTLKKLFGR